MAESLSSKLKRKKDASIGELATKRRKTDVSLCPTIVAASPLIDRTATVGESRRCDFAFYDCSCEELAEKLLGCLLVRSSSSSSASGAEGDKDGGESWRCYGRIVETEAYLGNDDKAAHSYGGRRTDRNEAMYMPPGTAYVYTIYGMHHCFNISSRGSGAAVLIRAIQPLGGLDGMRERRKVCKKSDKDLCNGPAKLCKAFGIDKSSNKDNLTSSDRVWVELQPCGGDGGDDSSDGGDGEEVVKCGRVGVDYAGKEWTEKPLRFYIRGSAFVSKINRVNITL